MRIVAAACGVPRWAPRTGSPAPSASVVVLFSGSDDPNAASPALWMPPSTAWIDVTGLSDEVLGRTVRLAETHDLYLSLTTRLANELHLAGRIVAAIDARRPLSEHRRDDLELALHEAVSNALVHGNLQVEGMKGVSMAALDRFSSDLAVRLADPVFSRRRIEVVLDFEHGAVVVEVGDEGRGFQLDGRGGHGASGRGLGLISTIAESYELLDGGRRIRMRFAL
ncbi:ATP-binding protein [Azospirillum sp. RWY-5-1]|uniref:ATP-binding protein n=2 Tax=Azospirillum oleiclasticum TaxID=2735135 RepID=A0ABX2TD06_9PROT|nr:ATP-binding protein [Azospirillum oleiclasticum]NYZ14788.1 ATP-binding protein [Azospirillum oleiclasticum]NYZ22226.1 ATP-binding protein [Azospirillum oleiclasticum]